LLKIEYQLVCFDGIHQNVALLLKQDELLRKISHGQNDPEIEVQPEFGRYQVEATPGHPYDTTINSILGVEQNMDTRSVAILVR
jgi:glutamate--cysteine ligase catalytic subunit